MNPRRIAHSVIHSRARALALAPLAAVALGCDRGEPRDASPAASSSPSAPVTAARLPVDSYFPPEEALRRFREGIRERPTEYRGGAPSRDSLVRLFVHALERNDAALVNSMIVSRAEFAYLYYPEHPLREPPYELDPQMMWFQLRSQSEKGIARALDRFGGEPFGYAGHSCPKESTRHGGNRVWEECTIMRALPTRDTVRLRLFGAIVERGGHYKFAGYGNDL